MYERYFSDREHERLKDRVEQQTEEIALHMAEIKRLEELELERFMALQAAESLLARAREVMAQTIPALDENYRWHRDAQTAPGKVKQAADILAAARAWMKETEHE